MQQRQRANNPPPRLAGSRGRSALHQRRDKAKAREAAGLPSPEPQPRADFLAALNALEPDLVHGKDDKAISRGLDTCSTLKRHPGDRSKQIETTAKRWTSPDHPEGRSLPMAEKVLDLSHKHLCPDF